MRGPVELQHQLGTTGYFHDSSLVKSTDGTLMGSPVWADIAWNDQHYPSITPVFDSVTKKLTLKLCSRDAAHTSIACG